MTRMQDDAQNYFNVWKPEHAEPTREEKVEDIENRKKNTDELALQYYNMVTAIFQKARMCGHLCRLSPGESVDQALVRHEHYLAHRINIQEGEKVIDVGCGIGHPARSIARFTGANITGLNINGMQLRQARKLTQEAGLGYQVNFVEHSFLDIPFADGTFDKAYAIEATCYAPTLKEVYSEVYRVLKPGGVFGLYEVVMTDKYDDNNPLHREVRLNVERGGGAAHIHTAAEAVEAMKASGFEILAVDDLAARDDQIPWETQLSDPWLETKGIVSGVFLNVLFAARANKLANRVLQTAVGKLEDFGVLPAGAQKVADLTVTIVDGMYRGGELGIFSPMFLMIGRKPEE